MKKLFIVDDNEDILFSLTIWFKRKGFEVQVFENSSSFLDAIKESMPDVMLLDINLNGEDGRDLCKKLKNDMHLSVEIIMISANDQALHGFRDPCASGTINKPFDLKEITDIVTLHCPT